MSEAENKDEGGRMKDESPTGLASSTSSRHREDATARQAGLAGFWHELKRRKVTRVAITYAVVAWLIMQVAGLTFEGFDVPVWAFRFVVIVLWLFFPVAIILAWAFELTPDGIKTTKVAAEARGDEPVSEKQQRKRNWFSMFFAAAVPTLIFGALAVIFYLRSDPADTLTPEAGNLTPGLVESDKSIAVLPFADMSEGGANEYFSDGISEELLNVLAKIPNLRVPARTSSFYFKGKNMPVLEIAQELNVEYLLEGSVRTAGDQVRITAQLVKASNGYHLWSDTFTRDLKNIFALQDEIAGLIAKQLHLELGLANDNSEVDPEAYRLMLEARFHWNQRGFEDFDKAEELMNRALKIDPDFAKAHATMAQLWVIRANYATIEYGTDVSEELAKLRQSASRAIELDPTLVEPYAAMAYWFHQERKVKEAVEWFEKALSINPLDPTTNRWYGEHLWVQGEVVAADKVYKIALENDPLHFLNAWTCAGLAYCLWNLEEAYRLNQRAESLRAGGFVPAKSAGGAMLCLLGREDEAVEMARSVRESWPNDFRILADVDAIWILHQAGLDEEVAEYSEKLLEALPTQSWKRGYLLTVLGRFEEAIPFLERSPTSFLLSLNTPFFDPYRDDPLFHRLLESLDWEEEYHKLRAEMAKARALNTK